MILKLPLCNQLLVIFLFFLFASARVPPLNNSPYIHILQITCVPYLYCYNDCLIFDVAVFLFSILWKCMLWNLKYNETKPKPEPNPMTV